MNASSLTLGCLVADYFPEPVTVTWDSGSLKRSTVAFPSAHNPASSLYTTVSQMTASGEWAKQTFTCSVAHAASTTNKTISGEPGWAVPLRPESGKIGWVGGGRAQVPPELGPWLVHGDPGLRGQPLTCRLIPSVCRGLLPAHCEALPLVLPAQRG